MSGVDVVDGFSAHPAYLTSETRYYPVVLLCGGRNAAEIMAHRFMKYICRCSISGQRGHISCLDPLVNRQENRIYTPLKVT